MRSLCAGVLVVSLKTWFLAGVSCIAAGQASAYEWWDGHHACIVENATYVSADGSKHGPWLDAPKTFFLKFTTCTDFAKAKGLPYSDDEPIDWQGDREAQFRVRSCVRNGVPNSSVVESEGIDFEFYDSTLRYQFSSISYLPLPGNDGTLILGKDGFVNYGSFGTLNSDRSEAWFTLRAHCTVLNK